MWIKAALSFLFAISTLTTSPQGDAIVIGKPKYIVRVSIFTVSDDDCLPYAKLYCADLKSALSHLSGVAVTDEELEKAVLSNARSAMSGFYIPIETGSILPLPTHQVDGDISLLKSYQISMSVNLKDLAQARYIDTFAEIANPDNWSTVSCASISRIVGSLSKEDRIEITSSQEMSRDLTPVIQQPDISPYIAEASKLILVDNDIEKLWLNAPEDNWKMSDNYVDTALAISPESAYCLVLKGYITEHLGDNKLASEYYAKAFSHDPNTRIALARLGVMHQRLGQIKEAVEDFRKLQSYWPEWQEGYYREGMLMLQTNEADKALSLFYKALNLD